MNFIDFTQSMESVLNFHNHNIMFHVLEAGVHVSLTGWEFTAVNPVHDWKQLFGDCTIWRQLQINTLNIELNTELALNELTLGVKMLRLRQSSLPIRWAQGPWTVYASWM